LKGVQGIDESDSRGGIDAGDASATSAKWSLGDEETTDWRWYYSKDRCLVGDRRKLVRETDVTCLVVQLEIEEGRREVRVLTR
jgi:hypothetical protein